ncbi:galectin-2 [Amia ocellicauda]|uniref:galectin-2 n=1 Tax=Amia ocellicauda TaxID=2972642 RepID=UPI0034640C41|nr:LEG1 protein [Amia calva]
MSEFEVKNMELRVGDKLKVKGRVLEDAERFQIDLGRDPDHLALHFNPRFHDDTDGEVIVCNSKCDGSWGSEQRDRAFPFEKGAEVKLTVKVTGEGFEVELPDNRELFFSDRLGLDTLNYIRVRGHFKVTSFKFS